MHFGQMKQAKRAYVKLFSGSKSTCNSIFIIVGLILMEKFVCFVTVKKIFNFGQIKVVIKNLLQKNFCLKNFNNFFFL
jgi:hypothetical protein